MATPTSLMGTGMPPDQASLVGSHIATITAAGTSAGTATAIPANTGVALVNGQSSQTGAILSASTPLAYPVYVFATGATAPVIYPPTGHTINSGASSVTMSAAISGAIFMRTSTTQWYTVPLAP